MDRWSQSKTDTAKAIWDRLLGCFGDSLLRKFGGEPPEEWVAGLSMLTVAQHERGLRRIVFGWKGGPPNLPDFMRLCRSVGTDDFDEGPPAAAPALPNPDNFNGDKWDIAANGLLMTHIRNRLAANSRVWGAPGKGDKPPSREMIAAVAVLVRWKKTWAAHMRDWGVDTDTGEVLMATGPERTKAWHDCMDSADMEIAEVMRVAA